MEILRLPAGEFAANVALLDAADYEQDQVLRGAIAGKKSAEGAMLALLWMIARER